MSNAIPKAQGVTTINAVVMSILNRLRNYSMRNYSYLEQVIIEKYSELNLFHLDNVEVVYLRMGTAKTVDVPADFVDWVKVGIPMNGKIRVITKDENILFPRTFEDGAEVGNADDVNSTVPGILFTSHWRNGEFVGGLYGLPGGIDTASYRFDRERRQFIFSGNVPRSEIVLEYISSGVSLQGTTNIPLEAVATLRNYGIWQLIENDPKVPLSEKERKKQQYEEELEALSYFQSIFTIDEYKRSVWKSTRQTIKR
jgi:hypothetical protein